MNANRRILLYGNSVILGSIGASLRRCPEFEVETIDTPLENPHAFDAAIPDIILFDLEASQPEAPFFLLQNHPDLMLVGISPGTNLVRVWSSRQQQEMSMLDLFELMKSREIGISDALAEPAVSRENA